MRLGDIEKWNRRLNAMSEEIIGAAFEVRNVLSAGFMEKVYENALNVEINLRD